MATLQKELLETIYTSTKESFSISRGRGAEFTLPATNKTVRIEEHMFLMIERI